MQLAGREETLHFPVPCDIHNSTMHRYLIREYVAIAKESYFGHRTNYEIYISSSRIEEKSNRRTRHFSLATEFFINFFLVVSYFEQVLCSLVLEVYKI